MSDIIIFEADAQHVEVLLEWESLWITQTQMAALFEVQKEGRCTIVRQVEHFRRQDNQVGYR